MVELRIGLLGAGRMGRIRASALSVHPSARVVKVYDPDAAAAARLAGELGMTAVASSDEAMTDVDAVIVSTPAAGHAAAALAATARGLPFLCEKPLAEDVETARAVVAAVAAAGIPTMVGFSKRFDPARRALEEAVRRGEIGAVEMVILTNRDPNTTSFRPLLEMIAARHAETPCLLVRESTVHDFDTARALLGAEIEEVHALGSTFASPEMAALAEPDAVMLTLRAAGGGLCHINGSWHTAYGYDQRIEVVGAAGMLRVENGPRPPVVHHDARGAHVGRMFEGPPGNADNWMHAFAEAYTAETFHFADAIRAGSTPLTSVRDGLEAQILVDAAIRSLRTGTPMRLATT
jgi:myo-inositol 2-dehydrogenase/D-chiro-inositol 1-dehydrogenase